MKRVFADTAYWVALLNARDDLHEKAKAISSSIGAARFITSEMVLTELLNYFGGKGERLRKMAAALAERLRNDPNMAIVPQTSVQFQGALSLYAERNDKAWSHTDCASILVMKDQEIQEALTHDRHFEQAGFRALLR